MADMNDPSRTPESRSRETAVAEPRSDNYERYLEDTYGYAYSARDIVAIESLERHDELVGRPTLDGREIDEQDLGDFERLGLARGLYRDGQFEAFCRQIEQLLDSDHEHPAVAYPELPLLAALVLRRADRYERAASILERGRELWPDAALPMTQQRALIILATRGPETAQQVYQSLADDHPDDPELRFEIAEDLWCQDHLEMAAQWADRAEEVAERVGDDPSLVDIQLLKRRLQE